MAIALLLGLLIAASPDAATVPVAPAPGAPVASAILVAGETISLDSSGSARIPAEASPSAEGLRFYHGRVDSGDASAIFYLPESSALAEWALPGLDASAPASIVVKETEGETWENARAFAAPLEKTKDGRRVRFAMPPGTWDLALVVPGFAPAFVTELDVYDGDDTVRVAAVKPEPAARVTARVLDARSGRPPDRWTAWISRVGGHGDDEEARFFDGRPIAENGAALDFSSLPVGDWELRAEATVGGGAGGRRRSRSAVKATKPRERVNLGDLYLTDTGALRVAVAFPTEVPDQELTCRVARPPISGEGELGVARGEGVRAECLDRPHVRRPRDRARHDPVRRQPGHLRPEDRDHRERRNRGSRILVRSASRVRHRAAGRGRRARGHGDGRRVRTGRPDRPGQVGRRRELPSRRLARARGDPAPDDSSRRPAPLRGESRGRGGRHEDRSRRPPALELDPRHRPRQGDRSGPRRRGGRVLGVARGEGLGVGTVLHVDDVRRRRTIPRRESPRQAPRGRRHARRVRAIR